MDPWPHPITALVEGVRTWASSQPGVKGLAVVGSWARGRARPDSDVDLILLTEAVAALVTDASWVGLFGTVLRTEAETWGNVRSIRTWYRDGPEVEFSIAPEDWAGLPLDPGAERVLREGVIVLYDPLASLSNALRSIRGPLPQSA